MLGIKMICTTDPIKDKLIDIETLDIDEDEVRGFESEGEFVGKSVNLLIEAGSYVCVAANLYRSADMTWNRDEAVLGGHMVRLYKLIDALLDQTCKHRRETSFTIARLVFECIVNLRYLVTNASDELFQTYRLYSLQHELRLLKRIEANISERGGDIEPIETRMINSILASFKASGFTREEIQDSPTRNWGEGNLYERAKSIGLGSAYLAAFGGGSHSVHGNWQDLLEYHLEKVNPNSFRAHLEWHLPRPQVLDALVLFISDAVSDYLEYMVGGGANEFSERLRDLQERTSRLTMLHEKFLVEGSGGA